MQVYWLCVASGLSRPSLLHNAVPDQASTEAANASNAHHRVAAHTSARLPAVLGFAGPHAMWSTRTTGQCLCSITSSQMAPRASTWWLMRRASSGRTTSRRPSQPWQTTLGVPMGRQGWRRAGSGAKRRARSRAKTPTSSSSSACACCGTMTLYVLTCPYCSNFSHRSDSLHQQPHILAPLFMWMQHKTAKGQTWLRLLLLGWILRVGQLAQDHC